MANNDEITYYSDIKTVPVEWLWYPYIPYGKITVLQGDPGDGKSTLMMQVIAAVSNGKNKIEGMHLSEPQKVIYQCSEDGVADTIKPRLERAGADCSNVCFIQEDDNFLTLDDERIRETIETTGARLLVIDPLQAYVGDDGNLTVATKARRLMQRLSSWATAYRCAIVLVGHLNKKEGTKSLYRSIGSIDVVASARSVLQIERVDSDQEIRVLRQVKCSLAAKGPNQYFIITHEGNLEWIDYDEEIEDGDVFEDDFAPTKQEQLSELLTRMLLNGPIPSITILNECISHGFSERTIKSVKKVVGIKSYRKDGQWFWQLNRKEE